jgi:hypothetical protein
MYPQRSTLRPSVSPLPGRVTFVLPGRITLSENLPAEIIRVATSVARRSKYLCKVIEQHALTNLPDTHIRLSNIDPIGFRMYTGWLKGGDIKFGITSTMTKGGLLLIDSFDYIFAHITGSQLEDSDFQDYIIDTMTRLLDPSQTPELKVLERVFLEKNASNMLKQFVVDTMFAVDRRMLAKMRGVVKESENNVHSDAGCKYHVHAEGECYKTKANSGYCKGANVSETAHEEFNMCKMNGLGNQSRWSSSSSSMYSNPSPKASLSDMANTQYFGSEEWSRQVHGLGRRKRTPQLRTDKPLPTIPLLTPGASPTASPPEYTQALPHVFPDRSHHESLNTELINECLNRLRPHSSTRYRSDDPSELQHAVVSSLVFECMERYQKASSDSASSYSSYTLDRSSSNPPRTLTPLLEQDRPSSPYLNHSSPGCHLHWQRSFESLPKPWRNHPRHSQPLDEFDGSIYGYPPTPRHERPTTPRYEGSATPQHTGSTTPQYLNPIEPQSSLDNPQIQILQNSTPNLVKRKPVPPRGSDWLEQYDCLNTMMNKDVPMVNAKRSKISRFKEILRSDSRLSLDIDERSRG